MSYEDPPKDHAAPEEYPGHDPDRRPLEEHIKSRSTWLRLFFMLVVLLLWSVTRVVLAAVILIQFFCVLFTGETNQPLKHLGEQLARYTYQLVRYLTFNSDERPFPFDLEWPSTRTEERPQDSA